MPSAATPATATKGAPFVNTLGMKFVPVPITGGPTGGQRVQDYEAFVKENKGTVQWTKPALPSGPTHPAVFVAWNDAQLFCQWLTERERKAGRISATEAYRLPTDHEWSCAVGIGEKEDPAKLPTDKDVKIQNVFPWGSAWPPPPGAGNLSGEEMEGQKLADSQEILHGYRDDFTGAAPVGSFAPNRFGIFDLAGNAREWCEDWVDASHLRRVVRGSGFNLSTESYCLSSVRSRDLPSTRRGSNYGFRCVLAPIAP